MKYLSRLLIALALAVSPTLASAQLSLINCAPAIPCTILGPSTTGTGDQAWLAFGKANQNFLNLQTQIQTVFGGNSGGVYYFNGTGLASSNTLATNQLMLGGGTGNGPFSLGSLGTTTTVLHGNGIGAPNFGAVNLSTDITGLTPVGNGGIGVGTLTGIAKGNGTAAFTPATFSDFAALATGTASSSTFVRGDGVWATPAGAGTVTTTGSPTTGSLASFSGATSIATGDLSGDCTTSGALAITCTKINGTAVTLGGAFTTAGAFATTLTVTATTNATLPSGTSNIGYLGVPNSGGAGNIYSSCHNPALADQGTKIVLNVSSPCAVTIPANSSVAFPTSSCFYVWNVPGSAVVTVAITTDALGVAGGTGTGSRTITAPATGGPAIGGFCKYDSTHWVTWLGNGET